MNNLDALRAAGLNPIIIDDADDLGEQLGHLLRGDAPRRPRETNIELVARIMDFCPTGPLVQPFVLHALETYCKMVDKATIEELSNGLFSGETWKATGAWVDAELAKHYARG